ncbi:MAG: hypothetical protein QF605_07355 [Rhodospirillales bacterium]|jgi:Asp-tRNA(Asn)/Glu-tRNA(Gln) amidotransferase A subunit family amidase|nr:hypothetical protein [Rhodospirillales bacterium]
MTGWMDRPLADMAQASHDSNVSAVEIAETAIARHDAWDDKLTAYEMWNAENALDQAKAADHALKSGNNLGSLIGITIPVELDKAGMPVGLQLLSRLHNDDTLLAVALVVEAVIGTPVERLGKSPLGGSL